MSNLNLTMLLQGRTPEENIGYHTAFEGLVADSSLTDYRAFPYRAAESQSDWKRLFDSVFEHMKSSGSDALFLQYFHHPPIPDPRSFIERVRSLPQRPIVATSCGDGFGPFRSPPPSSLPRAASMSDITFTTSLGRLARQLERAGARRITLLANSACDVRFGHIPAPPAAEDREFDLIFIGSKPGGRNFTRHLYWSGQRRLRYVKLLEKRYGRRFALFGHGWAGHRSWQGPLQFDEQATAPQRARVIFGGYPGSLCDYYTSDRPFIQMLSGTPMVDYAVPRVDRLLRNGEDWLLFADEDGAISRIDAILDGRVDGDAIGSSGAATVRNRHMNSHRARLIVTILNELAEARQVGRAPALPTLDFFQPDVDPQDEMSSALRQW